MGGVWDGRGRRSNSFLDVTQSPVCPSSSLPENKPNPKSLFSSSSLQTHHSHVQHLVNPILVFFLFPQVWTGWWGTPSPQTRCSPAGQVIPGAHPAPSLPCCPLGLVQGLSVLVGACRNILKYQTLGKGLALVNIIWLTLKFTFPYKNALYSSFC